MITLIEVVLLFIIILFSHIIITFFHELAHKRELNKYKIVSEVKWNVSGIIKSFGVVSMAGCFFDKKKFNKLKEKQKRRIILAGPYSDLIFIGLFLILTIFSWLYFKNIFLYYYLNLMLLTLIIKIPLNLFGKNSDFKKLKEN